MIQIIVFSKDRPCQLDALLRSIDDHYLIEHKTNIIYKAIDDDYSRGYAKCRELHSNVNWVPEENFRHNTNVLSTQHQRPYTTYFTDDDVVTGEFNVDTTFNRFESDTSILALSLRMGLNIDVHYVNDHKQPGPKSCVWNWRNFPDLWDWGYPMSIQGNVFRTNDLRGYVTKLIYDNPNYFEGAMYQKPLKAPYLICYPRSKVIGLQMNRVVESHSNRCGNHHQKYMNEKWMNGKRIRLAPLYDLIPSSPDLEVELEFEDG